MAELNNATNNTVVSGTSSNDVITNSGSNVSISGGAGDDTITSNGTTSTTNSTSQATETVTEYEDVYDYVTEYYTEYETKYRTKTGYVPNYSGSTSGSNSYTYEESYTVPVQKTRQVYKKTGTKPVQKTVTTNVNNPTTKTVNTSNVTINGGVGDDTINMSDSTGYSNNIIIYNAGDGDDIVYNFGAKGYSGTNTLSIAGDNYSTAMSGSNMIVTVGKGQITLVPGSSGDFPSIVGTSAVEVSSLTNPSTVSICSLVLFLVGSDFGVSKRPSCAGSSFKFKGDSGTMLSFSTALRIPNSFSNGLLSATVKFSASC